MDAHTSFDKRASFDEMCLFRDDPKPIGRIIHSSSSKILLPDSKIAIKSCGLDGTIMTTFNFAKGGIHCDGTLSDWNRQECNPSNTLQMKTKSCSDTEQYNLDFNCEAYYKINKDKSYLITSYGKHKPLHYNCWVIDLTPIRGSQFSWIQAVRMRDAQCSLLHARELIDVSTVDVTVWLQKDTRNDSHTISMRQDKDPTIYEKYTKDKILIMLRYDKNSRIRNVERRKDIKKARGESSEAFKRAFEERDYTECCYMPSGSAHLGRMNNGRQEGVTDRVSSAGYMKSDNQPKGGGRFKKKYEKKLEKERNFMYPSLPPLPSKGRSIEEEVRSFKLWNSLKPTVTKVHDSLPTLEVVLTEKIEMKRSENKRRGTVCLAVNSPNVGRGVIDPLARRGSRAPALPSFPFTLDTPRIEE
ncbi:DgyrCDS8792 [Dimorphilus gyrociliatus]|uniref:DgyrCDS8792 n=1 Tax=Dimorphilus gyrociliatus TaxID=2664684 RepID=A0A7I8VV65_9ANNE|nr:DgyrCDS8792 [Dimorphilus gyrociliatus]